MRTVVIPVLVVLMGHAYAAAPDLADCRTITNDAERLACFDELLSDASPANRSNESSNASEESPAIVDSDSSPTTKTAPPPAPADLGAESLPDKPGKGPKEEESFSATVTRCERMADRRYAFHFSNGQIWRQANNERLYLPDCSFDVTITKDFFGYKMQQVGEKKRIRIKRLR
jgi:hypothetical protein